MFDHLISTAFSLVLVIATTEKNIDELMRELINSNLKPDIVVIEGQKIPVFGDDYDFLEDLRVATVLKNLDKAAKREIDSVWFAFQRNEITDYAICLKSTRNNKINGSVLTVKDVCQDAIQRCVLVPLTMIPKENPKELIIPMPFEDTNFVEWLSSSKHKSLADLQIELVEKAVEDFESGNIKISKSYGDAVERIRQSYLQQPLRSEIVAYLHECKSKIQSEGPMVPQTLFSDVLIFDETSAKLLKSTLNEQ